MQQPAVRKPVLYFTVTANAAPAECCTVCDVHDASARAAGLEAAEEVNRTMTGVETRSVARDSLFLLADIRVEQGADVHRVRVRNLSDGGMMGEGHLHVQRGHRVTVELRNIGVIGGTVAWVQDNRFGVAFDDEIDSQQARRPLQATDQPAIALVEPSWAHRAPRPPLPSQLRKI